MQALEVPQSASMQGYLAAEDFENACKVLSALRHAPHPVCVCLCACMWQLSPTAQASLQAELLPLLSAVSL